MNIIESIVSEENCIENTMVIGKAKNSRYSFCLRPEGNPVAD